MIKIVSYKESWLAEFQQIGVVLRQTLGSLALRIDHIGSTAVPGLAAKDIIDIQITVATFDEPLTAKMQSLGYTQPEGIWRDHRPPGFVGPESDWEKRYFHEPIGQRSTNTHVRIQGRPNQRYPLLFRDYLRANPKTAEAYARLKNQLAQNLADPQSYPQVKDPAVDLIYFAAEAWAKHSHWNIQPSDA